MNKYKKLVNNTLIFTIGTIGTKLLSVIFLKFYSGQLTKAQISTTELIQTTINLLIPIATLCIADGVLRYGLQKKPDFTKLYTAGSALTFMGVFVAGVFFPIFNFLEYSKGYALIMLFFLLGSSFRMLNQYFVRARGYSKLFAADGIFTTLLWLILNYAFLNEKVNMGVTGFLLAIIISDFCSSIFLIFFAQNYRFVNLRKIDKKLIKDMLRYSIPLIPTYVLWWIVMASDKFLVRYMCDEDVNGLYSLAYKIPMLISVVSTVFFQAWQLSAISEHESDSKGAKKFYTNVFDAYISMMFVASAGLMLLIKPVTALLISADKVECYIFSPFLIVGVLMSSLCQFLSSIYNVTKRSQNALWTSAIAAGVNMVLNIILISIMGPQGAAVSTMISYFICCIVRISDTQRYIKYKISWRKMGFNSAVIFFMSLVLVCKLPAAPLWLILGCAVIGLINYPSILLTIRKILQNR